LFHVLQWSELVTDMHFMLQQEVVKRMSATPGNKAWGRLSLMCQYRCAVTPLFTVPPEAFSPAPKVQSAIVRLVPHAEPPVAITDMQAFERLVSQAFSQRRKTLRNSLRSFVSPSNMEGAGIDPGRRPETLSLEDFAVLTTLIDKNE
jgi:16S rRNA (adenine1518-N6/adenine1519-N6)-dimethyltransferase